MIAAIPACSFDELSTELTFRTPGRTITEADLVSFSALTGDWHPQHADAEWAARSQFGERIAHGMLIVSYGLGLIQLDPEWVVALRRLTRATFRNPVRIGDTICAEGRIATRRPIDERIGIVEIACRVGIHGAPTAVMFTAEVVWRRTAGATEEAER